MIARQVLCITPGVYEFVVAPLKPNLLPPLGGGRATASYRSVANHLNPAMEEHFATASDWLAKSRQ